MAYKSKCTCKGRGLASVFNWQYPHEKNCYYYQVVKDRQGQQAKMASMRRLVAHYRREMKEA